MSSPTTQHHKTVADYKQLGEGAPYELINGTLVKEPSPTYSHQGLLGEIFNKIWNHLQKNSLGNVLCAPMDVYFDDQNVLQPDIIFISNENKHLIHEDGIHGAPDFIVEILSPSTAYQDLKEKKQIYEEFGVKEYWIVDPKDQEVIGYSKQEKGFQEMVREHGQLQSPILSLSIQFDAS